MQDGEKDPRVWPESQAGLPVITHVLNMREINLVLLREKMVRIN